MADMLCASIFGWSGTATFFASRVSVVMRLAEVSGKGILESVSCDYVGFQLLVDKVLFNELINLLIFVGSCNIKYWGSCDHAGYLRFVVVASRLPSWKYSLVIDLLAGLFLFLLGCFEFR